MGVPTTKVDAAFDRREKPFRLEGFVDVGNLHLVPKLGHEPMIDQNDDGDLRQPRVSLHEIQELGRRSHRRHQIEDDDRWFGSGDHDAEGARAIGCLTNAKAPLFEESRDRTAAVGVVIDNEDVVEGRQCTAPRKGGA